MMALLNGTSLVQSWYIPFPYHTNHGTNMVGTPYIRRTIPWFSDGYGPHREEEKSKKSIFNFQKIKFEISKIIFLNSRSSLKEFLSPRNAKNDSQICQLTFPERLFP
jgi:hypothetical protein